MLFVEQRFVADQTEFTRFGICWKCAHKTLGAATCDAFPEGIPQDIILGDVNHRKAVAGDNGIQFKPVEDTDGS